MRQIQAIAMLLCLVAFAACGRGAKNLSQVVGDTVRMKYAKLLHIVEHDGYTVVSIDNPWQKGKQLHKYVLVPRAGHDARHLPDGTVVRVPLQRMIPFSIVHAGLALELGCADAIVGIADMQYVRIPHILQMHGQGKLVDVGNSMNPSVEKVMDASPDALLVSPFDGGGGFGRFEEAGIPIIECADYMEPSALGRAEWMKFYGLLMGRGKAADSLFAVVDSTYSALKSLAASSQTRRSVVLDKKTGSVWYLPGGRSTIGTMLADAGADYPFAANTDAGSLALPFESVLEKAGDADIWLFRYGGSTPATYDGLLSEFSGYGKLKAFRERMCYGCNVDKTLFYEETPFRPDFLLRDFVQVVHPEIQGLGGLRYFCLVEK